MQEIEKNQNETGRIMHKDEYDLLTHRIPYMKG